MRSKNETPSPTGTPEPFKFKFVVPKIIAQYAPALPSNPEVHNFAWNTANFTAVAATTSLSIVAVQSPIKTLILNISKSGSFLPAASGGVFAIVRSLYQGVSASISGSAVRTAYVTGAKGGKPKEEVSEGSVKEGKIKHPTSFSTFGYVLSAAFGDILVTQIPEQLSGLRKVNGLLPTDFKWRTMHNSYQLMAGGFVPRYVSGLVNFGALCVLEEKIASKSLIANKEMNHFFAGAVSGMTAAIISFPFTALKDYTLVQATVQDGKLVNKSTISVMKDLGSKLIADPKTATTAFFKNAAKQLPLRIALTGMIFSIVSGVGSLLGNEPLKDVVPERFHPPKTGKSPGFFNHSKERSIEEPVEIAANNSPRHDKV